MSPAFSSGCLRLPFAFGVSCLLPAPRRAPRNDIARATDIARNMVTRWGLSDNLCPLAYQEEEGEVFLGQSVTQHKHISEDTAKQVDAEVRAIIDRNYERAERLLNEHLATLHAMAEALITYETLDSDQIDDLMAGRAPREPKEPTDDGGGSVRQAPTRAEGDIVGPPAEQPA